MGHIGITPSNARVSDTTCRTEDLRPKRSVAVVFGMVSNNHIVVGLAMFPDLQGGLLREIETNRINLILHTRTLRLLTKSSRTHHALEYD
jgi:hypothetical protein